MKKLDKDTIANICLLLIGFAGLTICIVTNSRNNSSNKYKTIDKVNKEQFAVYIEDDNGDYAEYGSNVFPKGYDLNYDNSRCVDINGNLVENSLHYSSQGLTVISNKTLFCYLYFDKPFLVNYLINEETRPASLWTSTLDGDGYRFVGTAPSNYVCFGTTDKETCVGNTDLYMYRIIGIFKDVDGNHYVKLIKKEALNTAYKWVSSYINIGSWGSNDLYLGLNGSYFLSNTTYSYMQNTTWSSKIKDWTWSALNTLTAYDGLDYFFSSVTSSQIYYHEMNHANKPSTVGNWSTPNGKIGLMYVSDYMLSLGESALSYTGSSNYSTLKTGWMFLNNNDSSSLSTTGSEAPSTSEWTISEYGGEDSDYYAWSIYSGGYPYYSGMLTSYSVRPVFYLERTVEYISGTGTASDPYIIS